MSDDQPAYKHLFKLLIVGSAGCGKSQLLSRFVNDEFATAYQATIGVDFMVRTVDQDGTKVKLQIWDSAGQERFRSVTAAYYRGAMGIFLCYDVNSPESAMELKKWKGEIDQNGAPNVAVLLVGLKSDLNEDPDAKKIVDDFLAENPTLEHVTCSAKTSQGVESAVSALVDKILVVVEGGFSDSVATVTKKKKSKKTGHGFFGFGNIL
jgi:small GTP-binding protein